MKSGETVSHKWVYVVLAAFIVGLVAFWPRVFLIVDEERYVSQAVAFANGATSIPGAEILYPATGHSLISNHPPGTSLLQAPFVRIGGWRAGAMLSAMSLIVMTLITMQWLRSNAFHPAFALVIPGFFGAAFFGRIAMSDVPGAALVALTLYLLARAEKADWRASLLGGLSAGAVLLLREPLLVLVAPFLAGAVLRRRCVLWALVAGLVAGIGMRLGLSAMLFDSALYVRDSGYGFSLRSVSHNLPVYAGILLLMLPAGALLPFFYRGFRREEVITATALYVGVFLLYEYDPIRENGPAKGFVLASRFMIPLLPLFALMAADVWPRWFGAFTNRARRRTQWLILGACAGAGAVAFLVHPLAHAQESVPLAIVSRIQSTTESGVPVITNTHATLKYFSPAYGPRRLILRYNVSTDSTIAFAQRFGRLHLVLLDRTDSESYRQEAVDNERYLNAVRQRCAVQTTIDDRPGGSDGWAHLRVFEIRSCG